MNHDDRLEKISDVLCDIKIDLSMIQKDLEYHILRTDLAEQRIDLIDAKVKPIDFKIRAITWVGGGIIAITPLALKFMGML